MSTGIATPDVLPEVEEDVTEPDGRAHYVRITALLAGGPVVALCGKKYVPMVVGGSVLDLEPCGKCVELMGLLEAMQ